MPKPTIHVFVCSQSRPAGHPRGSCVHNGASELLQTFWAEAQKRARADVAITFSGCLGPCDRGPNVLVYPGSVLYNGVRPADVPAIFEEHLIGGSPVARLLAPATIWS